KKYEKELIRINNIEIKIKTTLLNKINTAVKRVAKKIEADFILNLGDGVVFARKKYDLTEEIIREILKLERRKSPVSR
ncbi:OmpH family outer membrane protein, partial [Spirochaetota bacterium]